MVQNFYFTHSILPLILDLWLPPQNSDVKLNILFFNKNLTFFSEFWRLKKKTVPQSFDKKIKQNKVEW